MTAQTFIKVDKAAFVASEDEVACVVWVRSADGTFPRDGIDVKGLEQVIALPSLALSIPLIEIYRRLFDRPSRDASHSPGG